MVNILDRKKYFPDEEEKKIIVRVEQFQVLCPFFLSILIQKQWIKSEDCDKAPTRSLELGLGLRLGMG